ncbi:hypothetical protein [Niallia sp. FSL W8-1348]|uniref:hypothetical protein n=1 Tax=Niallia sp. FSL W8-1348 TaxID=2954656 RepID=UPI0030F8C78A
MNKRNINLKKLKKDIAKKSLEELDDLCNTFLIFSLATKDNEYCVKDMRKACNMIIGELRRRGVTDEEDLTWEDE